MVNLQCGSLRFCSSWTWLGNGLCLWSSGNQLFHVLGLIQWNVAGKWQSSKKSSSSRDRKIWPCWVPAKAVCFLRQWTNQLPCGMRGAAQESYSSGTARALVTSLVPKWGHGHFWDLCKNWARALCIDLVQNDSCGWRMCGWGCRCKCLAPFISLLCVENMWVGVPFFNHCLCN